MNSERIAPEIDRELVDAIRDACREHGQDDVFANRLVSWIHGLSVGSANLESHTAVREYFDGLSSVIRLEDIDNES